MIYPDCCVDDEAVEEDIEDARLSKPKPMDKDPLASTGKQDKPSVSSVPSTAKKKKHEQAANDDSSLTHLLLDEKDKHRETFLKEKISHNETMEDFEKQKIVCREKTEQLDCIRKLLHFKQEMEGNGLTPKEIMAIVPDTKQLYKLLERHNNSSSSSEDDE